MMDANKASSRTTARIRATILVPLACLVLLAGPGVPTAEAGFRSPESTWKLGAISISVLRKQFDKTYVAVAFDTRDARPR